LSMKGCNRILVTAGSNSACDTIALRIIKCIEKITNLKPEDRKKLMLRLVPYTRFKKVKKSMNPKILNYVNLVRRNGSYAYEGLKKIKISQYGIVVTTLCTVGIVNLLNKPRFTHIFIDEAAASIEPETLLGMVGIMSKPCHVILSGDHKQLGAVIKNDRAASLGLAQSLMERLCSTNCTRWTPQETMTRHCRRDFDAITDPIQRSWASSTSFITMVSLYRWHQSRRSIKLPIGVFCPMESSQSYSKPRTEKLNEKITRQVVSISVKPM